MKALYPNKQRVSPSLLLCIISLLYACVPSLVAVVCVPSLVAAVWESSGDTGGTVDESPASGDIAYVILSLPESG